MGWTVVLRMTATHRLLSLEEMELRIQSYSKDTSGYTWTWRPPPLEEETSEKTHPSTLWLSFPAFQTEEKNSKALCWLSHHTCAVLFRWPWLTVTMDTYHDLFHRWGTWKIQRRLELHGQHLNQLDDTKTKALNQWFSTCWSWPLYGLNLSFTGVA